jgi:hypothetical protein
MDIERCKEVGEKLVKLTGEMVVDEGWSDEELADCLDEFRKSHGLTNEDLGFLADKLPLWWNGWGSPEKVN